MTRLLSSLSLIVVLAAASAGCTATGGSEADPETDSHIAIPTTDVVNETPTGALAVNEVVAAPDDGGTDWFELVVIGSDPVDLATVTVIDDNEEHEAAPVGSTTLQPGEFYVVKAISSDDSSDDPSVPFKLGKDDSLTVFINGEVVDTLDWSDGDAPSGTSFGRLPDGTGTAQMLTPTPGAANQAIENYTPPCTDPFDPTRVAKVELELSAAAWAAIKAQPEAEEFHEGAFVFDGERVEGVGIRTKGNSSLKSVSNMNTTRFPFKVDFNRYVDGQEFCGLKKLVFNNGFKDPSFMRESIAYKLAAEVGLKAPRTMYVDLYVGGEHVGLYLMVEPVDDDFYLEANFDNDNGDLYKPDWPDGDLNYRGDSLEDYEGVEIENNADTSDHSKLMNLIDIINNGPFDQLGTVLDVDMMLRYGAFNSVLVNLDSYTGNGHNYYLYEQDGVFTVIPWDLNEAFGNFNCGCDRDALIDFYIDEPSCGPIDSRPLMNAALSTSGGLDKYHDILSEMLAGSFNPETMAPWLTETADLIRPYVEADPTKFYSVDQFEQSITTDLQMGGGPGGGTTMGLESFVEDRYEAISKQLSGSQPSTNNGQGNCGGGGPGPGKPDGNNPKCPDGICDAFEQANPNVCPEDCQ